MYGEILQAVKTLATTYASPYTKIEVGTMPQNDGLAMQIGPGGEEWEYLNRASVHTMAIVLNGKNDDQQAVVTALSAIHRALTRLTDHPEGTNWEIISIKTTSSPGYINKASGQWLYGSILDVRFYSKGV